VLSLEPAAIATFFAQVLYNEPCSVSAGVTMFKSATIKEIRLLKSAITTLNSTITVGFLDMDSSWNVKTKLPGSGAMVPFTHVVF
jgi:hypothetical protein